MLMQNRQLPQQGNQENTNCRRKFHGVSRPNQLASTGGLSSVCPESPQAVQMSHRCSHSPGRSQNSWCSLSRDVLTLQPSWPSLAPKNGNHPVPVLYYNHWMCMRQSNLLWAIRWLFNLHLPACLPCRIIDQSTDGISERSIISWVYSLLDAIIIALVLVSSQIQDAHKHIFFVAWL